MTARSAGFGTAAMRLLASLAQPVPHSTTRAGKRSAAEEDRLVTADLAVRDQDGTLTISAAGRAHLARHQAGLAALSGLDPFRRQHGSISVREIGDGKDRRLVAEDQAESPLAWLARRNGRDGRPLIEPHQFLAGERLRLDFTRAQMMPRTTSSWETPVAREHRSGPRVDVYSDLAISAQQQLQLALQSAGPEFSGLLLDICCFLKRLEDVERERKWPARSAKIVLQLALERLARHYGLTAQAHGRARAKIGAWSASDPAKNAGED